MALGVALSVCVIPGAPLLAQVPVPDGYRMSEYRAPVPDRVPGAITVDTAEVRALIADGGDTILIDVLPRPPRPPGLPETTVWAPKPRHSLPGAIWLPNVGFGVLSDGQHRYFSEHLAGLGGGRPAARLVFFCLPDCWMSWNAAKRAAAWGYRNVYWYPDGSDGWSAAGLALEPVEPAPHVD
ncbi:MAG: PQQ-dependent catabolism-associated CXXCW motif protein [Inquilinus sp.]|nr:PQQ-dependent catabolism-associated CXXCW motif protein [Inquilinus sp.]